MKKLIIFIAFLFAASNTYATGIEALHRFISDTKTAQADFTQTVLNKDGSVKQQATGTVIFSRPGKFRWTYATPFKQIIVGDDDKIYLYDVDLAQVTIKHLDPAMGGSPAALLAGDNSMEKFYLLKDAGSHDGLSWLIATPKQKDSAFRQIAMGFDQHSLVEMKIYDNFGTTTAIKLSQMARNLKLPADAFKFIPPAGVDVISDHK